MSVISRDQSGDSGVARLEFCGDIVSASPERISAYTNALLARHVSYCYAHSRFYRERFDASGLRPEDVGRIEDLAAIGFTTKSDLSEHSDKLLCVSEREIVDVCQTSGTTGSPVCLLQSESDLRRLAYNERQCFSAAGLGPEDRVIVACALGRCFMAGLAYFEGLRSLGATAVRIGGGSPSLLAEGVLVHRPTAIVGVPSAILAAGRVLEGRGIDCGELGVRRLICIGEPVRNPDMSLSVLGERLSGLWSARVLGTYASTEMATSFAECDDGSGGGHIQPDLIVVEIVDDSGEAVRPGEPGEVVATPLQVTGMPLIRLKTGDISTLLTEPCGCGRNTFRLGPVLGRKSQMLKVRGTTLYPTAIFGALQQIEGVSNYLLEVYEDYELSDRPRVIVGVEDGVELDSGQVAERIRAAVRVRLEVELAPASEVRKRTMVEGRRKPVLVFDYRNIGKDGRF